MTAPPFDTALLDGLMERSGVDLLLASSKPVVRYLLGGYQSFFFAHADAIGLSRYLPILAYPLGAPDRAFYIGDQMEKGQQAVEPLWVGTARAASAGSADAMRHAVEACRHLGPAPGCIAVELPFIPADAFAVLHDAFPEARIVDAVSMLERLRARKSPAELAKLRRASEQVIASMLAVIAGHGPGTTKRALVEALRREQVDRGLEFDYCLITAGSSLNRAPSNATWNAGDILSLDSGGNYEGYIGDVCRMGILGEPDAELEDLLAEVDAVQEGAMRAVRPGAAGSAIYAGAETALRAARNGSGMAFVAHGMGIVSHEVPHLTGSGPVPYPPEDADASLEAGMVLSIETTLRHRRGFIKLEDTVAVREDGYEILGEAGRGWNRGLSLA